MHVFVVAVEVGAPTIRIAGKPLLAALEAAQEHCRASLPAAAGLKPLNSKEPAGRRRKSWAAPAPLPPERMGVSPLGAAQASKRTPRRGDACGEGRAGRPGSPAVSGGRAVPNRAQLRHAPRLVALLAEHLNRRVEHL